MDEWIDTVRVALRDAATPSERAAGAEALGWIELSLRFSDARRDRASPETPEAIADLTREQAIAWLLNRLRRVLASPATASTEEA